MVGRAGRNRWSGSSTITQILVLTGRSLRAITSDRRIVLLEVGQPLIQLVLVSQVFGSMANPKNFPPVVSYIYYLLPAILVTTGVTAAAGAGFGLIRDMENGTLARFRSLPISMHSVLFARSLTDLVRVAAQMVILLLA